MSSIKFQALGGGASIGANCYLVEQDGHQVLLDCGIHPKKEGVDALPRFCPLTSPPLAVLVSHGHIDHCGAVPWLLRRFHETDCYTTLPSVSIMERMLHNSVSVMETLAFERSIRDYPLYSHDEVDYVIRRAYGVRLEREFAVGWKSPIRASFHHSGHVLGGASILTRWPGHTLFYTSDICISHQELMGGLLPLDDSIKVDTLVIESTRAAQENGRALTLEREVRRFAREIAKVLKRGGSVLLPCFALGRCQEILNVVSRLMRSGKLPPAPIYVSGLGRAIYEIYDTYAEYLRPEADLRPLYEFRRVGDMAERATRRALLSSPCIIVATSGMMVESTPSALLAKDMVQETRHGIFFVGYLDPDSLGYKLLYAQPGDKLAFEYEGLHVEVVLENRQCFSFSSHAHRDELLWLINRIRPKNVVFVHGDPEAIEWMWGNCAGEFCKYVPQDDEPIVLET